MNLNAYDSIKTKIDKNKTWININTRTLLSREIANRKYYSIMQRYDNNVNSYDYYLALYDSIPNNVVSHKVRIDNYGRTKININSIIGCINVPIDSNEFNIDIVLVDKQEDGEVYKLIV